MDTALHEALERWGNFYLIAGSAAAALTGLQFVVQTLIASDERSMTGDPEAGIAAFGTPTVVHFALAMIVSALLCVPWPGYGALRVALTILATGALGYEAIVMRKARRQLVYATTVYDWIWYFALPVIAYAAVLVSSFMLARGRDGPLFALAASTLLLISVGIHNAWDTVTYMTVNVVRAKSGAGAPAAPASAPVGDTVTTAP